MRTTPAMHRTTLLIIKLIWETQLPPSRPELVTASELGGERLRQLLVRLQKAGLIVSELELEVEARARGGRRLLRYRLTPKGLRQAKRALQQEAVSSAEKTPPVQFRRLLGAARAVPHDLARMKHRRTADLLLH